MLGEEKSSITLDTVQNEKMNKVETTAITTSRVSCGFCWVGGGRHAHAAWQQSSLLGTSEQVSTQVSTASPPEGQGSVPDRSGHNMLPSGSPGTPLSHNHQHPWDHSWYMRATHSTPPTPSWSHINATVMTSWHGHPSNKSLFGWKGQDLKAACSQALAPSIWVQDAHLCLLPSVPFSFCQ